MTLRALAVAAALGLGAVLSQPAQATSMIELTPAQMVAASDTIVRGTVSEIWTERGPEGRIWTRVQLDVNEVHKGQPGLEEVVIDQLGGAWAGKVATVHGSATFSHGEDVLVYLEELESGMLVCVGMVQGKFTLKMDPVSRSKVAFQTPTAPNDTFDHRFYPLPPEGERLAYDDKVLEIEELTRLGWDGSEIPGVSLDELRARNPGVSR